MQIKLTTRIDRAPLIDNKSDGEEGGQPGRKKRTNPACNFGLTC